MTNIVTVAQTGSVKEVEFAEGMTVAEALTAAGINVGSGMEVRLNGNASEDMETVLESGDNILVVGAIRGA